MRIGVLCSGKLGSRVLRQLHEEHGVACVLTDSRSCDIHEWCESNAIPYYKGNPRNGKGFNFIKNFSLDVLASINYLFLIEKDLINYPSKLAFNIHGSLLPKYRGRTPHVWAIINNESKTGITAHRIEEGCDSGAIIEQVEIPIKKDQTGADLLKEYNDEYPQLVNRIISRLKTGQINFIKQDETLATYFGKRTPEDGLIIWDWHKERIYNWVRAQAHPYPGAFTYYEGVKITVDKVSYSDLGFSQDQDNGLILAVSPNLEIKVPNGVLRIDRLRNDNIRFEVGKKMTYENRK